jgi:hypothetical protein
VLIGLAGAGLAVWARPPADTPPTGPSGANLTRFSYRGTASCAASSCHDRGGPAGTVGSEYSTWAGRDPHHSAFAALYNERSRTIQTNRSVAGPAYRDSLCLACHATGGGDERSVAERSFGVGCESCHGPAEGYLAAHYQAGWPALDRRQKHEQYGLFPTGSLADRVQVCAACHVGHDGAEVDHDLIAAGHPRLAFEYTAYHHRLPRHWRETGYGPDFEARAWAIGQVASARAAVELLEARASRAAAENARQWPELAEYGCTACHHQLGTARSEGPLSQPRLAGTPPWGTWYLAEAELLARRPSGFPGAEGIDPGFARRLRELMRQPLPNPGRVAAEARSVARALDGWLGRFQARADEDARAGRALSAGEVRGLLLATLDAPTGTDRDHDTQHALAVLALTQSLVRQDAGCRGPALLAAAAELTRPLRTAAGGYSPAAYRDALWKFRAVIDPAR